ncbi:MAG TPA: PTS sugar transporter subunit IIA [Phycisphaerae bacterium]|nr:PTS sugar transporter subunit IIA [Phycisphaerae bacterium]
MKLTDVLRPDCVKAPLAAKDKTQAIVELVDLLNKAGVIRDREAVLQSVLEREARRSTGIGHGLAIPHGKSSACDELVMAIGKPAEPIAFDSIDGQPAQIIVLLASPVDQTGPHIQALARISRIMTIESVRSDMFNAESADELYRIIASYES